MADKDRLTTSDIADQAKRTDDSSQTSDLTVDDARARLDRSSSDTNARARSTNDTAGEARDVDAMSISPQKPAEPARSQGNGDVKGTTPASVRASAEGAETALLDDGEAEDLRRRWTDIQTNFVDRPKDSVSQADELVAETIKRLAEGFADERDNLENVWSRGGDVSTEDLRVALQRYRSFFERLLSA